MESMDDLLAQLKAEYEEKDNPKKPGKQQPLPIKLSPQVSVVPTPQIQVSRRKSFLSRCEEQLLADIKSEFEEQEKAEALKRQEQLEEEQRRQEEIKQQEKQALIQEAEQWLKKLKPRSEEGLWFEELAYGYPSKLEAAIDYLQALKEVKD